eukprot:tig00020539_g10401.t1
MSSSSFGSVIKAHSELLNSVVKCATKFGPFVEVIDNAIVVSDDVKVDISVVAITSTTKPGGDEKTSLVVRDKSGGIPRKALKELTSVGAPPDGTRRATTLSRFGVGLKCAANMDKVNGATVVLTTNEDEYHAVVYQRRVPDGSTGSEKQLHAEVFTNLEYDVKGRALKKTDPLAVALRTFADDGLMGVVSNELASLTQSDECGTTVIFLDFNNGGNFIWDNERKDLAYVVKKGNRELAADTLAGFLALLYPGIRNRIPECSICVGGDQPVNFHSIEDAFDRKGGKISNFSVDNGPFAGTVFVGAPSEDGPYSRSPFGFGPGRVLLVSFVRVIGSFPIPTGRLGIPPGHGIVLHTKNSVETNPTKDDVPAATGEKIITELAKKLPYQAVAAPTAAPVRVAERSNKFTQLFDEHDALQSPYVCEKNKFGLAPSEDLSEPARLFDENKQVGSDITDCKRFKEVIKNRCLLAVELIYHVADPAVRERMDAENLAKRCTKMVIGGKICTMGKLGEAIRAIVCAPYGTLEALRAKYVELAKDTRVQELLVEYSTYDYKKPKDDDAPKKRKLERDDRNADGKKPSKRAKKSVKTNSKGDDAGDDDAPKKRKAPRNDRDKGKKKPAKRLQKNAESEPESDDATESETED